MNGEFKRPYPKTSVASSVFSSAVSSATKMHLLATDAQRANRQFSSMEETDELRKAYLAIIEAPDCKKQMEDAATQITLDLMKSLNQQPIVNTSFTIAHNGNLYQFDSSDNKFITIGRKTSCDIRFNESYRTSRLHAMIMPLPQLGIYLVVDMGGIIGIMTEKRSNSNVCTNSVPNIRNTIVLEWNEIAILKLGNERIAINPKECVICLAKPRTITFNCGHHTTCDDCSNKITKCPLCRQVIKGFGQQGFMFKTNVNGSN